MATLNTLLNGLLSDTTAQQNSRNETARNRYHAKKIASRLGIKITRENASDGFGYWIEYHVEQVGSKGWTDQLYCHAWDEVREKLEAIEAGEKR